MLFLQIFLCVCVSWLTNCSYFCGGCRKRHGQKGGGVWVRWRRERGKSRVLLTFTASHSKIATPRAALFLQTSLPPRGAYHKRSPALLGQSKGLV